MIIKDRDKPVIEDYAIIDDNKFYLCVFTTKELGLIQKPSYHGNKYAIACLNSQFTGGNCWDNPFEDLKNHILIRWEIRMFDTFSDLAAFMIGQATKTIII